MSLTQATICTNYLTLIKPLKWTKFDWSLFQHQLYNKIIAESLKIFHMRFTSTISGADDTNDNLALNGLYLIPFILRYFTILYIFFAYSSSYKILCVYLSTKENYRFIDNKYMIDIIKLRKSIWFNVLTISKLWT